MKPNRSVSAKLNKSTTTLRLVLGDQLNAGHSWYKESDPSVVYLVAELHQEMNYVKHHVQKVCAFFAAMEQFSNALSKAGHQVIYLTLDETKDFSLEKLIIEIIKQHKLTQFDYQRPDEYRLYQQLKNMSFSDNLSVSCYDTEHFLLPYDDIEKEFKANKHVKMEFFYRRMRKRFNILMDDDQPRGGKWNFDSENRNSFKEDDLNDIPDPIVFKNDVKNCLKRLEKHSIKTFGKATEQLIWPINRQQSRDVLKFFCEHQLHNFGQFQDAMTDQSKFSWSLYHSRLSFALNAKMISPKEVIVTVLDYFEKHSKEIDIAQVEGFVRQILGWREFVRAIYWRNMPDYAKKNSLQAQRSLPDYFWDGNTKMNCVKQCVNQSLNYAYAHHIQRLMVTGTFCLLTGIHPDEVDAWYLGIYIDAIEWVEMPNTRGMTQFADNGIVATKPYAASGAYINKMSDYCKSCAYNVKHKTEDDACPFNSLYWHFVHRHEKKFSNNGRMNMVYNSWRKMKSDNKQAILKKADQLLNNIAEL
ncbi:MAG: cryptochrome/photolyase family protein [Gammaproteobacteria bacterium]|nr:cryptochrome/photolyase family protein [Gammaproteobacteria bacterium]